VLQQLEAGDDVERRGLLRGECLGGDEPVIDVAARFGLCSFATPSAFSPRSMPSTTAPRAAIPSARMPPPQPTSTTRLPARPPLIRSIHSRRSGFIRCNGPNITLSGSHQ
jgi:hypothetical protein